MPYKDPNKRRDVEAQYRAKSKDKKRAYMREYMREYRKDNAQEPILKPFVGVDGEGGTVDGKHSYYLLRFGDQVLYKNGTPLSTKECLAFLVASYEENTYRIPVAYFFNYDVTMMLRDLPEEKLRELYDRDSRAFVDKDGRTRHRRVIVDEKYSVDCLPGKWLEIVRYDSGEFVRVEISDTASFFQCSFVKALKLWKIGSAETIQRIENEKARRSSFTGTYSAEEIEYNREEVVLLEQLMTALREACYECDIRPTKWQGAGQLSGAMHRSHKTPRRNDYSIPHEVRNAAQNAYFGGRFETAFTGDIKGPIWEADISSAYPAAMTHLPCPLHGQWINQKRLPKTPHYLALISWKADRSMLWGPFLWRQKSGRICAPVEGLGWHHGFEIQEALQHKVKIRTHDVWVWCQECDCKSFDWIPEKFNERISLGAQSKGIILKLGLNGLYGKLCQSVGFATYANPVLAGAITSWTRARLYNTLQYHEPRDVLMMATDAVYLRDTPKFPVSEHKTLGGWEPQKFNEIFIVQPGLYYRDGLPPKTRGLPIRLVGGRLQLFKDAWKRDGWDAVVPIEIPNSFIGAREALHRRKPELSGQWVSETRNISFHSVKREESRILHGIGHTRMLSAAPCMSTTYKKPIGGLQGIGSVLHESMDTHSAFPEHPDGSLNEIDQIFGDF